jgi:hypothetical protein
MSSPNSEAQVISVQTVSFASRRGRMVPIQFVAACGAWVEGDRSCVIGAALAKRPVNQSHDSENYRHDTPRESIEGAVAATVVKNIKA